MACNISGRVPGITASIAPRRDRDPVGARLPQQPAVAKIPVALPASPLVPSEPADLTEPAKINGETSHDRATDAQGTPKGAWKITFLLFLFMLVNFADKIVVGLAGAPIMDELKLSPEQFGLLGSSFFFLFSISAIVVGFIVNRVDTRWVLLVMAVIWSLAQFPMVGTVSFTTLLICRVILGAGEGPALSVAAHAIYKWFPEREADDADRHSLAGLGVRRDPRGAGAELDHRQS